MSQYLEQSIAAFLEHQDRIREQMQTMMGAANPLTMMGRFADQNMAVWNMFAPRNGEEGGPDGTEAGPTDKKTASTAEADTGERKKG
jgi:polyhydroxyalkanoate synthesis regulator protein